MPASPSPLSDASPAAAHLLGIGGGILIALGLAAFAGASVYKAVKLRSAAWIAAAGLGVVFLGLDLVFMAALLSGEAPAGFQKTALPAAVTALIAPAKTQTVRGRDLDYALAVPGDWTVKRSVDAYDLFAYRKSLYLGVIAEEASVGTPEKIAAAARAQLEQVGSDVQCGDPAPLELDGRAWLQFEAKCRVDGIPVAYQFYVYSGEEGTFQLIGWTSQMLYARDGDLMRKVMQTFTFPKAPPAAPATPPAPAAPPAAQ